MAEVVVAGTVCVDLFPTLLDSPGFEPGKLSEIGPLAHRPGGCVANTGRALAQLGIDVALVGDAGDDWLGRLLVQGLSREGADTAGIRLLPDRNTSYSVVLEPPGQDRMFWHHPGANDGFDGSDLELGSARLLHIGYPALLPALSAGGAAGLERLLTRARDARVTTSLDLCLVPPSRRLELDWEELLCRILPLVDVFVPSTEDLASVLEHDRSDAELADLLLEWGAAVVMLTCGDRGVELRGAARARLEQAGHVLGPRAGTWADARFHVLAFGVEASGTTGAGDAAAAGLLYGLLRGDAPARCGALAAAAGAAAVESGGAVPAAELLTARIDEGWSRGAGSVPTAGAA